MVSVQKTPRRKNIFKTLVSGVNGQFHTSVSGWEWRNPIPTQIPTPTWFMGSLTDISMSARKYTFVLPLIPQSGYFQTTLHLSSFLLHVTLHSRQFLFERENKSSSAGWNSLQHSAPPLSTNIHEGLVPIAVERGTTSSLCFICFPKDIFTKPLLAHIFFLFKIFWGMWIIFQVFIEFVTILLLFYVLVFWPRGMWDLSSPTRDGTCTLCIGRQSLNH